MNQTLEGVRKRLQRDSISLRGMQETSGARPPGSQGDTHTQYTHMRAGGSCKKAYIPGSPYSSNLIPK